MAFQSFLAGRRLDGECTGDAQETVGCFVLLGEQLVGIFFSSGPLFFAHGLLFRAKYLA